MAEAIDPLLGTPVKLTQESLLSDRFSFHPYSGILPVADAQISLCGNPRPTHRQIKTICVLALRALDLHKTFAQADLVK